MSKSIFFINSRLDSTKDYRYDMEKDNDPLSESYFTPIDDVSDEEIANVIKNLAVADERECTFGIILVKEDVIEPVPGRKLKIPRSKNQVCIYYFHELFDSVMGDADFRAICKNYKAIVIKEMKQIKSN